MPGEATLDRAELLARLHAGLSARRTPQEVLVDLVDLGADAHVPAEVAEQMHQVAAGFARFGAAMPATYRRHPGLGRAYAAAAAAVGRALHAAGLEPIPAADPTCPWSLAEWLGRARDVLRLPGPARPPLRRAPKQVTVAYDDWECTMRARPRGRRGDRGGHVDVRTRMDSAALAVALPGVSSRAYLAAVRAVAHLFRRTVVLAAERDREAAVRYGKARLAGTVDLAAFAECERTAAFVAYYTARLGLRTVFTSGPQARPMDTIARALLDAALEAPGCRADVLARVVTHQKVLARLDESERAQLLADTYAVMVATARTLRRAWDPGRRDMVVRAGDDSSSWNAASRAFNQARTGWLNLTRALGLGHVVEESCPGKVPALVAADVARWHRMDGGGAHVDTAVFTDLPKPWDVVLDGAECTADMVRAACRAHGLDPDKAGWTAPYRQDGLAEATVALNLVHGIVVPDPDLAAALRRAGVFSGQAPTSLLVRQVAAR